MFFAFTKPAKAPTCWNPLGRKYKNTCQMERWCDQHEDYHSCRRPIASKETRLCGEHDTQLAEILARRGIPA